MKVFNQNVPVEFYQAFTEFVQNSTLHAKAGTIALFTDLATMEVYAAFTPPDSNRPRPVGRGSTPSSLFMQVQAALEPRPMAPSLPDVLKHPGPGRWWWLSFCDNDKPEGKQFLGVAIVEGRTLRDAIDVARGLSIHPGGKVACVACTRWIARAKWRNRLLSRAEVIAAGNDMEPLAT